MKRDQYRQKVSTGDGDQMIERDLAERLEQIESLLLTLVERGTKKEYYSTSEVARILERSDFTVREWCRLGRIWAEKRQTGRGNSKEWMISSVELDRIRNEGLLPL